MTKKFDGQVALVTGGASGIGHASALAFAAPPSALDCPASAYAAARATAPYRNASLGANSSCGGSSGRWTMVIPPEEPRQAGLTIRRGSGRRPAKAAGRRAAASGPARKSAAVSVSKGTTGISRPTISRLKRDLSIPTDEGPTPLPV